MFTQTQICIPCIPEVIQNDTASWGEAEQARRGRTVEIVLNFHATFAINMGKAWTYLCLISSVRV